ncbi:MAG: hypothetical protein M1269_09885 [Chloroflexi bacterium]|nr:hypothetical protein [Chloroflexota bacterium]
MDKWEYLTIDLRKITWIDKDYLSASPELAIVGDEGWELVCADGYYLFFKKKKG